MGINPNMKPLHPGRIISWVAAGLIVLLIGGNSFASVEYGHIGLYKTFGKLNDNMLSPGIHFKIPFFQSVIQVNT